MIDPLGGSWYVEQLTDKLEADAECYFDEIDKFGGVIPAIEDGFFQREIAYAASDYQRKIDSKRRIVVGVNEFIKENEKIEIPLLEIGKESEQAQLAAIKKLRAERDEVQVKVALQAVSAACASDVNLMPPIIAAAKAYATLGEIVIAMKTIFGEWQETTVF